MIAGETIIDFHGHNGRWNMYMQSDDPRMILRALDAVGIDRACLFNIFHPDMKTGHESLARVVNAYPDRFIGFAYATAQGQDMLEQVKHAIDELGFIAIKIYPPYGNISLLSARWRSLFEFADDRGLTIISHTGVESSCHPRLLAEIAPLYPNANFVAGHSGNIQPYRDQACDAARTIPNVYIETCSTYREHGAIEYLVRRAGAEKILYGSDLPLMDPRSQIGKIMTARISDEDKRLILGRNAIRLLKPGRRRAKEISKTERQYVPVVSH